jgi:hypothetical protein
MQLSKWFRRRDGNFTSGPVRRQPASSEGDIMRYALLWLLGVPIPILIVIYLLFH